MQDNTNPRRKKLLLIIIAFFVLLIGILLIPTLTEIFHQNPFGEEIKINNFNDYYSSVPRDRRDVMYRALYQMVAKNTDDTEITPDINASIRQNTAETIENEKSNTYYGSFIVDISALQQSYRISFEWSASGKTSDLSGDSLLVSCVNSSEVIYENFVCTDNSTKQQQEEEKVLTSFPIMQDLPIQIEYYKDGYGEYIHYDIYGDLSYKDGQNSFKIYIKDYTGGNYEAALQRIIDLGYKPSDYEIEYTNYNMYPPARAD